MEAIESGLSPAGRHNFPMVPPLHHVCHAQCRQRGLPGVPSPSGGRSWKRWQEHLSLHSSMKRKLSATLSESSLSSLLTDPAASRKAATASGQLQLSLHYLVSVPMCNSHIVVALW